MAAKGTAAQRQLHNDADKFIYVCDTHIYKLLGLKHTHSREGQRIRKAYSPPPSLFN